MESVIGQLASLCPERQEKIGYERQISKEEWNHDDLGMKMRLLLEVIDLYGATEPIYLIFGNVEDGESTLGDGDIDQGGCCCGGLLRWLGMRRRLWRRL